MIEVREYTDPAGRSPFEKWFIGLDARAAAKVTVALARIEQGNRSNVKGVGGGVSELRIDYGPGYRIYFGKDGERLVILLGGGTKKRQGADIEAARRLWQEYKARKNVERLNVALTRDFKETIKARSATDAAFRSALLTEALECFLSGDAQTGKAVLRDYINATIGFEALGKETGRPPKSLMRMLGPRGNPQARNLFDVIAYLQKREGVHVEVHLAR